MKIVVITGTNSGIGKATAKRFLQLPADEYTVYGIDIEETPSELEEFDNYIHIQRDVRNKNSLPIIQDVNILINNAGVQNSGDDIGVNLKGLMNTTEVYGLQPTIESIINLASSSAHTGSEFGEYTASKGGVISYTKWTAKQVANYKATCNSLSFGGVDTELNTCVTTNPELWEKIMELTPLKRWCSPEEAAEWIYFMAVTNKSCSGQDILIDNLEFLSHKFIWTE